MSNGRFRSFACQKNPRVIRVIRVIRGIRGGGGLNPALGFHRVKYRKLLGETGQARRRDRDVPNKLSHAYWPGFVSSIGAAAWQPGSLAA